MVSIAVLVLLILLVTRIIGSASTIATLGNKHMDADSEARQLFNRMEVDFPQIVKRADLDFFGKRTAAPNSVGGAMTGNDQIAFYSAVPGYYPSTGSQSPVSLAAYRVNAKNQVERMGKGLVWNGVSAIDTPILFMPLTIAGAWLPATTNATDPDYEIVGPQTFRFEYYYQLQRGDLSDTPWDSDPILIPAHTSVSGLRDVGAIIVVIGSIDPKSRALVTDAKLTALAGQMNDYVHFNSPGNSGKVGPQPQVQWQDAVNTNTAGLPNAALAGIRFYQRYFYLNGQQQ